MLKHSVDERWYQEAFDYFYLQVFEPLRSEEFTNYEVSKFISALNLKKGSKILDLGCGYGRHSIALKKAGYHVIGIDYSDILLRKARENSESIGLDIEWIKSDMRDITFVDEFDVIINNAFGYLEDDQEELKVLQAVYKALKPGGKLLQWELPNKPHWAKHFTAIVTEKIPDGFLIQEREYDFNTAKEYQQFSLILEGHPIYKRKFAVRIFDLIDLKKMYQTVGLTFIKAGDLEGNDLTINTQEMMIISKKEKKE